MFQVTGSPIVVWLIVSSIGQVSVECRPGVGQVSVKYRPSVGQVSAKCRPSIGEVSAKCRRGIGDLESYVGRHTCRSTVDRVSIDTRSTYRDIDSRDIAVDITYSKHDPSRKGILPFSSISLVNWMLVFCLFKCSWNSSILLSCTAVIVSST